MKQEQLPQSIEEAGREFVSALLRHFHQDPPDVSEDTEEAAAA